MNPTNRPVHPAAKKAPDAQQKRREIGVAVEPAKLRILHEVLDRRVVDLGFLPRKNPSHVREEEPGMSGRVDIQRGVGVQMMAPVDGSPTIAPLAGHRSGP